MIGGVDPVLRSWSVWTLLLLGLLAVGALWDLHQRRIPNPLVLSLAAAGLGVSVWLRPFPAALWLSMGGFLVGGVVWLVPYLLRMAGAADLKLAAAVGIWLGPLTVLRASLSAALVGGVMALFWLVWRRGPMGSWVFVTTLPRTIGARSAGAAARLGSGGTLPFAVAFAVGVGLELAGLSLFGGGR